MKIGSYILKGTCIGTVAGSLGGAYLIGESDKPFRKAKQLDNDCYAAIPMEISGFIAGGLSSVSIVYGPFVGAARKLVFMVLKKLFHCYVHYQSQSKSEL